MSYVKLKQGSRSRCSEYQLCCLEELVFSNEYPRRVEGRVAFLLPLMMLFHLFVKTPIGHLKTQQMNLPG